MVLMLLGPLCGWWGAPTGGGAWMDFSRERYRTRHRGGFGRGPPPNATAESDAEDAGASTGEPATPKR